MTAFQLCGLDNPPRFRVGHSKIIWEVAHYSDQCDIVVISRLTFAAEGGKKFALGLTYRQRYLDPDTIIWPVTGAEDPPHGS